MRNNMLLPRHDEDGDVSAAGLLQPKAPPSPSCCSCCCLLRPQERVKLLLSTALDDAAEDVMRFLDRSSSPSSSVVWRSREGTTNESCYSEEAGRYAIGVVLSLTQRLWELASTVTLPIFDDGVAATDSGRRGQEEEQQVEGGGEPCAPIVQLWDCRDGREGSRREGEQRG